MKDSDIDTLSADGAQEARPHTAAGRAHSLVEEAEAMGERMPRTPTARRLVDEFADYGWVDDFLAIEAEAADLRVPQEAEGTSGSGNPEAADPSGLRAALERLVDAADRLVYGPHQPPTWITSLQGLSDELVNARAALAAKDSAADPSGLTSASGRCDVIVNNGMGEPTECGRTLPCQYHGPEAEGLRAAERLRVAVLDRSASSRRPDPTRRRHPPR